MPPRLFLAAFLVLSPSTLLASPPSSPAVTAFMGVCMLARGDLATAQQTASHAGFSHSLDPQVKIGLVRDGAPPETVVLVKTDMAVVAEPNGPCTVFSSEPDSHASLAAIRYWLPPENSLLTYEAEVLTDDDSRFSVAFKIRTPNGPFADWVFSYSRKPTKYNIAITFVPRI